MTEAPFIVFFGTRQWCNHRHWQAPALIKEVLHSLYSLQTVENCNKRKYLFVLEVQRSNYQWWTVASIWTLKGQNSATVLSPHPLSNQMSSEGWASHYSCGIHSSGVFSQVKIFPLKSVSWSQQNQCKSVETSRCFEFWATPLNVIFSALGKVNAFSI